jgi:uncharacterized repeat protein (TIGR03803 family)
VLSGMALYGTTRFGGLSNAPAPYGMGTVFKLNADGTGYTVLKAFSGDTPIAGLVSSGSKLYGTTSEGGSNGCGTVFQMNTDGSGYSLLKTFNGSDGHNPGAQLVMSGTTLYGTTGGRGGYSDYGAVFRLELPLAPALRTQPRTQTAEAGATVHFAVQAVGAPPPVYQWFFNGTNILSFTNFDLVLTNILSSQSGTYAVVVTNVFRAETSAPATLNVIAPVDRSLVPAVKMMGEAGSLLNVDYANSLSATPSWPSLATVTLASTSQYCFDLSQPLPPQRFYRAWQTGTPSVRPSLDLRIVPAITLTGNIGHSVRVDYINRFGPIDAWVTLDTVTLTNTSQLYFDTSAPGQPQRLYRLVQVP